MFLAVSMPFRPRFDRVCRGHTEFADFVKSTYLRCFDPVRRRLGCVGQIKTVGSERQPNDVKTLNTKGVFIQVLSDFCSSLVRVWDVLTKQNNEGPNNIQTATKRAGNERVRNDHVPLVFFAFRPSFDVVSSEFSSRFLFGIFLFSRDF